MECTHGWLEPLVARLANDRSVVAVPLIDFISETDLRYSAPYTSISMFRWNLIFNWFVKFSRVFPTSNEKKELINFFILKTGLMCQKKS